MFDTNLFDWAMTSIWLMTEEACLSMFVLYKHLMEIKASGSISREMLIQLWQENEGQGLGEALHKTPSDQLAIERKSSTPLEGTRYVRSRPDMPGVGIIDLIGPIYPRANAMTMSGGVSAEMWARDFQTAYDSPGFKAIVMHIDSPGGDARQIAALSKLIFDLRNKNEKSIYAYASGHMASAAYYIGSSAHKIVVDPWASIGSIGVRSAVGPNDSGQIEFISDHSEMKGADPATDSGKQYFQQRVNEMGQMFRQDVARNRGVSIEKVNADFGRGGVLIGASAVKAGLADKVGTFEGTLRRLVTGRSPGTISQGDRATLVAELSSALEGEDDTMALDAFILKLRDRIKSKPPAQVENPAVEEKPTRESLQDRYGDEAVDFAANAIMTNKVLPAEAEDKAIDYLNARVDDELYGGQVYFKDTNDKDVAGTRIERERAKLARMPTHSLAGKRIKSLREGDSEGHVIGPNAPDASGRNEDAEPSKERIDQLLAKSSQGRRVLSVAKQQ